MAVKEFWNRKNDDEDRDLPKGIKKWERDVGGWRDDQSGNRYWLKWDQLLEWEQRNDATATDEEFYEWFGEFRKTRGIKVGGSSRWGSGSSKAYEDVTWEYEEKPKGGWLSGWWSKEIFRGWGTGGDNATKLALALQAIRSVIRVVDDNVPPMHVSWSGSEEGESYTDFKGQKIVVNPKPISDSKVGDGEAIDICTGFGLHEAGHSQHSRAPYDTLTKPTELSPMQIAGLLLNIAEDVRIESEVMKEYPGFTSYFEKTLKWAWGSISKKDAPKEYGPDLQSKLMTMLWSCRWPVESAAILTHPSFEPEIKWWQAWRDEYLAGKYGSRETVERGLEHLRLPSEEEQKAGKGEPNPDGSPQPGGKGDASKKMDEMSKEEEAIRKAIASTKEFIDKMIAKGKMEGTCVSKVNEEALDAEVARKVNTLVEEELEVDKATLPAPSGMSAPPIHITHPKEDADSRRSFIGKPAGILQRLKAALVFRQELPRWDDRLLKEGTLDDEELWRWKDKDYRVFHEEVIINRPRVQLGMLVDMSGSMCSGTKLKTAQELAQLLLMSAKDMDGVTPVVWGHTGDNNEISCDIFRLWDHGEPVSRLGLVSTLPHGNNYDGFAIEWCVRQLMVRGEQNEQRMLLVLSDGYPAGSDYGGTSAERHMKQVSDWAAKQGVTVIQIAIDPAVRPEHQAAMFREWLQFTSMQDLPKQLTKLLAKHT